MNGFVGAMVPVFVTWMIPLVPVFYGVIREAVADSGRSLRKAALIGAHEGARRPIRNGEAPSAAVDLP